MDNPSFKVLYQPLPKRKRLAAQIAVEVILTPIAIGLAAAIMLTFRPSGLQSVSFLHYVMLASFGVWIPLAVFTFREYGAALLKALQKRTIDRMSFSFEDEESLQLVRSQLESERAPDVLFAPEVEREGRPLRKTLIPGIQRTGAKAQSKTGPQLGESAKG